MSVKSLFFAAPALTIGPGSASAQEEVLSGTN